MNIYRIWAIQMGFAHIALPKGISQREEEVCFFVTKRFIYIYGGRK